MSELPKGWTTVALDEIADIHGGGRLKLSGKHFVPEGTPAFGAGGLNGYVETVEYSRPGIILSSIGARCGKCFYVEGQWTSLANTQVILPRLDRVDPKFLWYQLDDELRWPRSGSGQPFIKPSDVKARRVHLPPLPEQRHIAAILDKAGEVGARTEEASSRIWSAQLAIFRRLFGHPSTWRDLWQMSTIGELADSVQYGTSAKAGAAGAFPILRMGNVTMEGQLDLGDLKYLDLADGDIAKYTTQRGDLLFNRTNSVEQVGKTGVVDTDESLAIAGYLVRVRLKDGISPNFVATYLNSPYGQQLRRGMAKAAVSQANINATQLKQTPIALPPASVQDEFERLVRRLQEQQKNLERLKDTTNRLTRSLQSRAFRGEL